MVQNAKSSEIGDFSIKRLFLGHFQASFLGSITVLWPTSTSAIIGREPGWIFEQFWVHRRPQNLSKASNQSKIPPKNDTFLYMGLVDTLMQLKNGSKSSYMDLYVLSQISTGQPTKKWILSRNLVHF